MSKGIRCALNSRKHVRMHQLKSNSTPNEDKLTLNEVFDRRIRCVRKCAAFLFVVSNTAKQRWKQSCHQEPRKTIDTFDKWYKKWIVIALNKKTWTRLEEACVEQTELDDDEWYLNPDNTL